MNTTPLQTEPILITERYFRNVVANPWWVILLSAIFIIISAVFVPSTVMDTRSDAFIDPEEPALIYREKVEELFGLADPIVIAITNDSPSGIFNPSSLRLVEELTIAVQGLANVDPDRVVSLATEANIVGTQEGMEVEDFFEIPPTTEARVQWIKHAIDNFPLYQGNLVARDHSATLIVVELIDEHEADISYNNILELANSANLGPNDKVHVAGEGAIAGYLSAYIGADAQKLNPLAAVVITIILFLTFLTLRGALLPNIIILGTVAATFGMMAAFGVPFFVITNGLTVSLIAMAVADSIHVFSQYYIERQHDQLASQQTLVVRALTNMWGPITLTTITTAAGFFSLYLTSSMPPIQYFGLFGGIGVILAWLFSVTLLPAMLSLLKPANSRMFTASHTGLSQDWTSTLMLRIGRMVLGYPKTIVLSGLLVSALGVMGALKVTVEEVRIANFQMDEPIYLADAAMNTRMDGVYHLDVLVETEEYEGLHSAAHLKRIDRLQRFLESQPGVGGTTSVVDYIKQMHRAVNENSPDAYSIPEDSQLISQLFLLYSASADPTDFEDEIDGEYRQALVRAKINNGSYLKNTPVVLATEAYLRDEFNAPGITGKLTGRVNVDHYWIKEIGSSHINSVAFAFLAMVLVVSLLFRSFVAGMVTTIPVAMAILLIYSWMGISDVWLGVGTTMFASIAIGLCVDFTIHTVERLRHLLRDPPQDVTVAMLQLYPTTGRALFYNLAAIALGFGVLITSDVPPLINFGTLVALAVLVAFIASLTLLPALILLTRPAFIFSQSSETLRPKLTTAVSTCIVLLVSVTAALSFSNVLADTLEDSGKNIMDKLSAEQLIQSVNARDEGQQVSRNLNIELIDRRGKIRRQETRGFRRYFGDEKRTVIFYRAPANIRDTAFLTYDYSSTDKDDDQWLYLPALRKVRRVSASDRGDYFLGTDFTYEEIKKENKIELGDYTFKRLGQEIVDGVDCFVVEGIPKTNAIAKELGYSKVVWRIDPLIWMSRSSDYWDVNGNHLKTITTPVIKQIDGIWSALEIRAINHKTQHRSVFTFANIDYKEEVPAKLFEQRSLTRGL